jgi:hypothetical protein
MKVKIVNVDVEKVVKGKNSYSKAAVTYLFEGQARTQNVMSFTNPAVFKAVQDNVGKEVEVVVTKNDAGYNQWASVGEVGSASAAPPNAAAPTTSTGTATRVTGSNYETKEERAARQVYIVKQSSISAAIALSEANKAKATPEEIIEVAGKFVDYVFAKEAEASLETLENDIPF